MANKPNSSEFGTSVDYTGLRAQIWNEIKDLDVMIQRAEGGKKFTRYERA